MLRNWLRSLFSGKTMTSTKAPRRTRSVSSYKPEVEGLENRELLSTAATPGYLLEQSTLYRITGSTQTFIDTNVQTYEASQDGSTVYCLEKTNGILRRFGPQDGAQGYLVNPGVASFHVDGDGVFILYTTYGEFERRVPGVSSYHIDYGVQSFAPTGTSGTVYELFQDGTFDKVNVGVSRYRIDTGVKDFSLDGDGSVCELFQDGTLDDDFAGVSRSRLATGVQALAHHGFLGSNGMLYDNGVPVWANTRTFSIGPDGSLYRLDSSNELCHETPSGADIFVDDLVQSTAFTPEGDLLVLRGGGNLYNFRDGMSSTNYNLVDDLVQSYAVTPQGDLLVLRGGGNLYNFRDGRSATNYNFVDDLVQSYAVTSQGDLLVLRGGGNLYDFGNGHSPTSYISLGILGTTAPLPSGTAGQIYNMPINSSGSPVDCNYSIVAGALPSGLSLSSSGVLSGTTTTAGTFYFNVQVAGNGTSLSGNQVYSLTINPGAPASVSVSSFYDGSVISAGVSFNVLIGVKDAWGNGCNGSVTLTSSDGFSQTLTVSAGVASATVTDTNDTVHTVNFTAATTNGLTGTDSLSVVKAPLASMIVFAPGSIIAGSDLKNVAISSAKDLLGNPYTGFVQLYVNGSPLAGPGSSVSVTNGSGSTTIALTTSTIFLSHAGSYTFSGGAGVSGSTSVTVYAAAATAFTVSATSATSVGGTVSVSVTAVDPYGNMATSFNGTVTLTSSNGQVLSSTSVQLKNGIGSTTLRANHSGNSTLTATSGAVRGTSNIVSVSPTEFYWVCSVTVYDGYNENLGTWQFSTVEPNVQAALNDLSTFEHNLEQQLENEGYYLGGGSGVYATPLVQNPAN